MSDLLQPWPGLHSSQFAWEPKKEFFRFGMRVWDVKKAKEIIIAKPRPVLTFRPEWVQRIMWSIMAEPSTAEQARWPIILITDWLEAVKEENIFPIDGWHRLRYGLANDVPELPAVLLTREESLAVEDRPKTRRRR